MSEKKGISRKDYKKSSKKNNATKPKTWLKRIILALITVFLLVIIAGGALFTYYASNAPELTEEDLVGTFSTELVDRDGDIFYTLGGENREYAEANEYPEVMIDAMTAIEDQRFHDHIGIDPIGIARAALGYVTNQGQIVGGGSTITQQLVKLSVFSTERADQTLERKAQEAWLALQLEREKSKEQIMTLYLNKIHMAGNVYGVATAAEEYYDKPVSELEIHEAALFAGMAKAPNRYSPYANPELAKERRDTVISVMLEEGHITDEEAQKAYDTPIDEGLVEQTESDSNALVIDAYLMRVLDEVGEKTNLNPNTAGLTIHTNIDMDAQKHVFDVLNSDEYVDYIKDGVEAGLSLVEADTGKIAALGGGRNTQILLGQNRATQIKQTGSTIKPLSTYGPAIEYLKYSTYHQIVDEEYTIPGTDFSPRNYDRQYKGQISMRESLVDSRNVPTAKLFNEDLEMNQIEAFMTNLGIPIDQMSNEGVLVPQNAYNGEMSTLQMASSYAAFANGGQYTEPYAVSKVITQDGQEIDLTPETNQAMSDYTAYMITDMLKDVADNYSNYVGLGNIPQAGKTGTTNFTTDELNELGYPSGAVPDSWYTGYTTNYSLAVWTGFDSKKDGYLSFEDQSRLIPRRIYQEIMQYVSRNKENKDWQKPASVKTVTVEKGTDPAKLPGPNTPESQLITELFVEGNIPTEKSLNYGRELNTPTGLSAEYDKNNDELIVSWDEYTLENDDENVSYNLSINNSVTTLNNTEYRMSEPPRGNVAITLSVSAYNTTGPETSVTVEISGPENDEDTEDKPKDDSGEESEDNSENESGENQDSNENEPNSNNDQNTDEKENNSKEDSPSSSDSETNKDENSEDNEQSSNNENNDNNNNNKKPDDANETSEENNNN
ncbi:transglycosylase domain-containing protein [Alkalibacterium kapii]|uniref:Peptidoglycan glycosyltransferase n=1 Tax=Alkalibacterium kapii TaxID=426704 RepID=A0A511AV80_9LACT|nr:transglycosylase domain-containing protein [Alkalibacterium kapii]GEK91572.1 peptidoglycan glycosyltransferase [Alkalibacterium kapii]